MNQVLEQMYIDKDKLFSLLSRLFSSSEVSVEVCHHYPLVVMALTIMWQDDGDNFIMTLPRMLTEVNSPSK